MLYASGSFTGNGTSQSVTGLAFQPELVIIRVHGTTGTPRCIFRTASHSGNSTSHTVGAIANFTGGITSLNSDGFSVGADAAANGNGLTVHWTAYAKNGLNDLDYGSYTGNGTDNTTVAVTTFDPNFVVVKQNGTERGIWRTSDTGTNSLAFENLANSSNRIKALSTGGGNTFTIGTDARVNTNTVAYFWFAFKAVTAHLATGSYTGNGTSQSITGLAFAPVFAWVKPDFTDNGGQKMPTNTSNVSYPDFGNSTGVTTGITSFNSDGFSVGSNAVFNNNTKTHYYVVLGVPVNTSIKTVLGLAIASVKTWNGLAIASVKTVNGLA